MTALTRAGREPTPICCYTKWDVPVLEQQQGKNKWLCRIHDFKPTLAANGQRDSRRMNAVKVSAATGDYQLTMREVNRFPCRFGMFPDVFKDAWLRERVLMPIYDYECNKCHHRLSWRRASPRTAAPNARNVRVRPAGSLHRCRSFLKVPVFTSQTIRKITRLYAREKWHRSKAEKKVETAKPAVAPKKDW